VPVPLPNLVPCPRPLLQYLYHCQTTSTRARAKTATSAASALKPLLPLPKLAVPLAGQVPTPVGCLTTLCAVIPWFSGEFLTPIVNFLIFCYLLRFCRVKFGTEGSGVNGWNEGRNNRFWCRCHFWGERLDWFYCLGWLRRHNWLRNLSWFCCWGGSFSVPELVVGCAVLQQMARRGDRSNYWRLN